MGWKGGKQATYLFWKPLMHLHMPNLPVKKHHVNYEHSKAFRSYDFTGRGKLKIVHFFIMKAITEARLFYLFTVWYSEEKVLWACASKNYEKCISIIRVKYLTNVEERLKVISQMYLWHWKKSLIWFQVIFRLMIFLLNRENVDQWIIRGPVPDNGGQECLLRWV